MGLKITHADALCAIRRHLHARARLFSLCATCKTGGRTHTCTTLPASHLCRHGQFTAWLRRREAQRSSMEGTICSQLTLSDHHTTLCRQGWDACMWVPHACTCPCLLRLLAPDHMVTFRPNLIACQGEYQVGEARQQTRDCTIKAAHTRLHNQTAYAHS